VFHISVYRNTLDDSTPDVTADIYVPRTMDAKIVREQIIAKMGLPPNITSLGYNINKEHNRQYHELSNDEEMKRALEMMGDFNDRASSLQPIMTVKNLVRKFLRLMRWHASVSFHVSRFLSLTQVTCRNLCLSSVLPTRKRVRKRSDPHRKPTR
jgi:hypothetical protein